MLPWIKFKQNQRMQEGAWLLYILIDTLTDHGNLPAIHLPFQMTWPIMKSLV